MVVYNLKFMVANFIMNLIKMSTVKPYLNDLKKSVGFIQPILTPNGIE